MEGHKTSGALASLALASLKQMMTSLYQLHQRLQAEDEQNSIGICFFIFSWRQTLIHVFSSFYSFLQMYLCAAWSDTVVRSFVGRSVDWFCRFSIVQNNVQLIRTNLMVACDEAACHKKILTTLGGFAFSCIASATKSQKQRNSKTWT